MVQQPAGLTRAVFVELLVKSEESPGETRQFPVGRLSATTRFRKGPRRETDASLLEWDRKIIHSFRDTGFSILSSPAPGEPVLSPLKSKRRNP